MDIIFLLGYHFLVFPSPPTPPPPSPRAFAQSFEVIPSILAENAGLNPIATITDLRNRHALGETHAGINVRKVRAPWKHFKHFITFNKNGSKKRQIFQGSIYFLTYYHKVLM